MMRPVVLMLLSALFCAALSAQPSAPEERFELARAHYDAARYEEAAALYESLLDEGYNAFALHYNLGNAHYQLGNTGPSILHYEKARRLEPNNPNLLHNLELANLRQQDKRIEPLPRNVFERSWSSYTGLMSQRNWSLATLAVAWAFLACLALYGFSRSIGLRRTGLLLSASCIVLLVLSLLGTLGRMRWDASQQFGVIMSPSAVLKSAPNISSTDLYILREGFVLRLGQQSGDWWEVSLPDGNLGWIEARQLTEI
jgi:tetratricopeptide (TPR) repeat protein